MSVSEAASTGDRRKGLEALRAALSEATDTAIALKQPAVVAQLAGPLRAVLAEIAELPTQEASQVDDLVARREANRATTDAQLRPKKRRPRTEQRGS